MNADSAPAPDTEPASAPAPAPLSGKPDVSEPQVFLDYISGIQLPGGKGKLIDGIPKFDQLAELIQKGGKDEEVKRIFQFISYEDIEEICKNINDKTEMNFVKVSEKLFPRMEGNFGSASYEHIPSELNRKEGSDAGKFHNPIVGEVSPIVGNSPKNVVYMANLFTYFFTKVINNPEDGNKLFGVGGIFPSYLLNKELKDFDFALATKIPNFRFYMRYIVIYFMIFVRVAQLKGKFDDIKFKERDFRIKFKEDSEPQKNYNIASGAHNNEKSLNFNVRIGDTDNEFEGLDLVLLRGTDDAGKETDIDKPYGDEVSDDTLYRNIIKDAERRETYLNVMYGSMELKDTVDGQIQTHIVVSDYFTKDVDFRTKFVEAFAQWKHVPTKGITTFTVPNNSIYRVGRVIKMYLKKWFNPDGSLDVIRGNKQALYDIVMSGEIDVLSDKSNSLEVNLFKLMGKNRTYGLLTEIVQKKLAQILYDTEFIFGYAPDRERDTYERFEKKILSLIGSYFHVDKHEKYILELYILCIAYSHLKNGDNFITNLMKFFTIMNDPKYKLNKANSVVYRSNTLKNIILYQNVGGMRANHTFIRYVNILEFGLKVNDILQLGQMEHLKGTIKVEIEKINSNKEAIKGFIDTKRDAYIDKVKGEIQAIRAAIKSGGGKKKEKGPKIPNIKAINGKFRRETINIGVLGLNTYEVYDNDNKDIDVEIMKLIDAITILDRLNNELELVEGFKVDDYNRMIVIKQEEIFGEPAAAPPAAEPAAAAPVAEGGRRLTKKKRQGRKKKKTYINKRK